MNKLTNSIFDPEISTIVKVSRIASATILTACAAIFYSILAL